MSESLQIFEFNTSPIRVIAREGEPWFVAKDVCDVLEISNLSSSVNMLEEDERGLHTVETPSGMQQLTVISEAGLYSLVLRSRKPEAKAFKRWITHDVLPSIRKNGLYGTPLTIDRMIADPDFAIQLLTNLKQEQLARAAAEQAKAEAEQKLAFEKEQRDLAEDQRDRAIRTKAEIGSRREATAMNTAAQLSKQKEILEEHLGVSANWKRAAVIPWLEDIFGKPSNHLLSLIGKHLTHLSADMGETVYQVEDMLFDKVNCYHKDVIEAFRQQLLRDPSMLSIFRKDLR